MDLAHGLNDDSQRGGDVLGKKDRVGAKYLINTTLTSPKLVQRTLYGSYKRNHRDLRACSTNRDSVPMEFRVEGGDLVDIKLWSAGTPEILLS
jgi:hypothetical protein